MLEFLFAAALLLGFFTKLADLQVDDEKFFFKNAQYLTGVAYGILGGLLLTSEPHFSTLFFGVLVGVIITTKIDKLPHRLAVAFVVLMIALRGIPAVSFPLVAFFSLFAAGDEWLHEKTAKKKGKINAALAFLGKNRLLLEVGTMLAGIATGEWLYLLAIISFDVGYVTCKKVFGK